jgi:hypothetical protein
MGATTKSRLDLTETHYTWCIEIKTMDTPRTKFIVSVCPKRAADASPVKMVATVEEYFFKIVSGNPTTPRDKRT